MISVNNLKEELKKRLKTMEEGNILEVTTYKRNRGFVIICLSKGSYHLKEFGYESRDESPLSKETLLKLCQKIAKVEFPRSQQVRVYQHEDGEANLISESIEIRI